MSIRKVQRTLYFTQRTLGDIDAAKRGKLAKRLARRTATRSAFSFLRWLSK